MILHHSILAPICTHEKANAGVHRQTCQIHVFFCNVNDYFVDNFGNNLMI